MAINKNYWLGGFWTGGQANGLEWSRGKWTGGEWQRGNWRSNDLDQNYNDSDPNKNEWSIWEGGTWNSNGTEYSPEYIQDKSDLETILEQEDSVWYGGTWKSNKNPGSKYSWQGSNVDGANPYGSLASFDSGDRTILLPQSQSIWLGGHWLRGVFKGGIFANGHWHSLLNDVTINNTNWYENAYDQESSKFLEGSFVQSIWEGGMVRNGSQDGFNVLFGMNISDDFRRVFDDSGFQNSIGMVENNELLEKRYLGTKTIDWQTYYTNNNQAGVLDSLKIMRWNQTTNDSYFIPQDMSEGGTYSVIWKRGSFSKGVFSFGQWYDTDTTGNLKLSYDRSDYSNNDFSSANSVFLDGFFYKSLWLNGVCRAKNIGSSMGTVFSRSIWATGMWLAEGRRDEYTYNRYVSNAKFWKSIWLSGRWTGGKLSMSTWLSLNAFGEPINFDGLEITPTETLGSLTLFDNWLENPLGKRDDITYYQPTTDFYTEEFEKIIYDFNRSDMLESYEFGNFQPDALAPNSESFFFEFGPDANDVEIPNGDPNPENGDGYSSALGSSRFFDGGPYDVELSDAELILLASTSGNPVTNENWPNERFFDSQDQDQISLFNEGAFFSLPDTEVERFIRFSGQVDNAASIWENGCSEGSSWHGGIWTAGSFEPYKFKNYPTNVIDSENRVVQLDFFDEDVRLESDNAKTQKGIWHRGLWYAGYFRQKCFFLATPAYRSNSGLTLDLDSRLGLQQSDADLFFNSPSADGNFIDLRPLNHASIFARKTLRGSRGMFSIFNGYFMSGLFYDGRKNQDPTHEIPILGTRAFIEDNLATSIIENDGIQFPIENYGPELIFGGLAFRNGLNKLESIGIVYSELDLTIKNDPDATSNLRIEAGEPYIFWDSATNAGPGDLEDTIGRYEYPGNFNAWKQDGIEAFYLRWTESDLLLDLTTTPLEDDALFKDIRHASIKEGSPLLIWADVISNNDDSIPSFAQGCGETPEPYYPKLPNLNWPCD